MLSPSGRRGFHGRFSVAQPTGELRSQDGSATGDRHPRPGDIAPFIGGEEHVDRRQFDGLTSAAQRRVFPERWHLLRGHGRRNQRCPDGTWPTTSRVTPLSKTTARSSIASTATPPT